MERLGSDPFEIFANLYLKTSFSLFPPPFPPLPETTTIAFANVDNVVVTATWNPFSSPGSRLIAFYSYHYFPLLLTSSPAPTKSLGYSPLSGTRMVLSLAPVFSPNSSQSALPRSSPVHTFHLTSTSSASSPITAFGLPTTTTTLPPLFPSASLSHLRLRVLVLNTFNLLWTSVGTNMYLRYASCPRGVPPSRRTYFCSPLISFRVIPSLPRDRDSPSPFLIPSSFLTHLSFS